MATQAWLESTLRRSALLGLEVRERASRRSVDWTNLSPSRTPTTADGDQQNPLKVTHTNLDEAFETIGAFMAETTYQCMNFHRFNHCTEFSEVERTHVSRFHTHRATGRATPNLPTCKQGNSSSTAEDFHIEVSPGTYTVTAGTQDSQQQTRMVSVNAGDSVKLTFDLSPLPGSVSPF